MKASVVDVRTGKEQLTNDFRFTWCREDGEPLKRMVVPMTYQGKSPLHVVSDGYFGYMLMSVLAEAMWWVEGKRALDLGAEIRSIRTAKRA